MNPSEYCPDTQDQLAVWMHAAHEQPPHPLYPVGGRTSWHPPQVQEPHSVISTARLARVIDYPARDMTVTVEAGMRVSELATLLATERQRLAVDIARPDQATVGGAVAANASGPRRFGLGTLRDYVIGLSAVDARGRAFKAGGRVVKNVAGYDLCKMLVGSQGTLAVISQLTFKLKPIPESTAFLWVIFSDYETVDLGLERLITSSTRPVAVELLSPSAAQQIISRTGLNLPTKYPVVCLGYEGTAQETQWQVETVRLEQRAAGADNSYVVGDAQAPALWNSLIAQTVCDSPLMFKARMRPSKIAQFVYRAAAADAAIQAHAANGIVIGQFSLDTAPAQMSALLLALQEYTRQADGSLSLVHCDPALRSEIYLTPDPPTSAGLMIKLKAELDPRQVLNPPAMREFGLEMPPPTVNAGQR